MTIHTPIASPTTERAHFGISADDVRRELRVRMAHEGIRAKTWAARHGFTDAFVSAVLCGHKEPSERMCAALGLEKRVIYVRRAVADNG